MNSLFNSSLPYFICLNLCMLADKAVDIMLHFSVSFLEEKLQFNQYTCSHEKDLNK